MKVYLFECARKSSLYGFTPQSDGTNLPLDSCKSWRPHSKISVDIEHNSPNFWSGITPAEVLDSIAEKGYFLCAISITFTEFDEATRK